MDPSNPDSFNHRTETLSTGRSYHFVDQKPDGYDSEKTLTLLLVHGFPDLWYGWKYQIGPFVNAGYRVIVPDMLGYGGSDMPNETAEYTISKLCADLVALLDVIELSKVVIMGHDWGSVIVGRFVVWYPERVIASVLLSVAMVPESPIKSTKELVDLCPSYGFQLYFEDESSTEEIDSHLPTFYTITVCRAGANELFNKPEIVRSYIIGEEPLDRGGCLLTDKEMDYYVSQTKSMHGALSYYRTGSLFSFEEEKAANLKFEISSSIPVLFIRGTMDHASPPEFVETMRQVIPHVKTVDLDVGHWIMMEAKDLVAHEILEWLREHDLKCQV